MSLKQGSEMTTKDPEPEMRARETPTKEETIFQTSPCRCDDYDVIMPIMVDERLLDYDMGSQFPVPVHVGHGTFGHVFRVRLKNAEDPKIPLCIKEVSSDWLNKHDIIEEARKLLYLTGTAYVPLCFGIVEFSVKDSNLKHYGILQEFIGEGQTLQTFLRHRSKQLDKSVWISIAFQLARGMEKIHKKNILLNDVKANNIVMAKKDNSYRIKFVDFGLASYRLGRRFIQSGNCHRLKHLAPEVRRGHVTRRASDMYSLGWLLRQISLCGHVIDLLLISHMCMRDTPTHRLTAHSARVLITNIVDE